LTKLSKVHDLKVISRTSVMQYKGVKRNLREIGEELNVGVVVEGSVRKAANQVRITAQLIDARTDEHLWAESYDRELSNIFEVQSDVAQKIVEALQVNVSATEQHQIKSTQTENTEAYQLYLQGREYWDLRSEEDVNRAIDCFNRAIEIDPSYALAYVGLADCHTVLANNLSLNTTENFAAATSAIEKALSLDDELGEAYTSDAQLKMRHYDWENAESSFKRAISLNPNYATAHLWYGLMLAIVGRTEEATKCFDIAIDLDPNSFPIQLNVGQLLLNQRKFEEAEQAFRAINENSPGQTGWCAYYLGLSLFFMDRYDEAAALFEKSIQNFSSGRFTMMSLSTLLAIDAIQGDLLSAYKKLAQLLELQRKSGMVSIYVGWAYDALGERELALDYFEEALEEQYQTIHWVNANPLFDQFRDEPRFQEILKKMRLLDD
jgi:tetratricopeptide (TPR) repeat protein